MPTIARLARALTLGVAWLLMVPSVPVLFVWFLSGWIWISSQGTSYSCMASQGELIYGDGYRDTVKRAKIDSGWLPGAHPAWKLWEFRSGAYGKFSLGAPAVGVVLLGAGLHWIARARHRRGCCRRCGYDLRGLPSRVCPECGTVARQTTPTGVVPTVSQEEETKATLRRRMSGVLAGIAPEALGIESARACARAVDSGLIEDGSTVMLYAPAAALGEIDLGPLATELVARGCRLCVPRVDWAARAMTPVLVANLTMDLVPDAGAPGGGGRGMRAARPEAPAISPSEVDVVVVPGLAFDRFGGRLGRGAGFYDRFLAGLGRERPLRVALALDAQVVDRVPVEAHDQRLHVVITPTEVIRAEPPTQGK